MSRRATLLLLFGALACDGGPASPGAGPRLAFSSPSVSVGTARHAVLEISNDGEGTLGPVVIRGGPVTDSGGVAVPGVSLEVAPREIPTLGPGESRALAVEVRLAATVRPGTYRAVLEAAAAGATAAAEVDFRVPHPAALEAARVSVTGPGALRRGDVADFAARVEDGAGALLEGAPVAWAVLPAGAGLLEGNGRFVAYGTGTLRVVATVGAVADTATVEVAPRGDEGSLVVVGRGPEAARHTSDLWVHGDHAYLGTWSVRRTSLGVHPGNTLYTWDVSDPSAPRRTDSLVVDARVVNDVKVRADGRLAVLTHEGSADERNGVTFLDLADPAAPRPLVRYTRGLEPGVHNAWLDGEHAYVAVDGAGGGLRILDVSRPSEPREVSRFYAGSSVLHDVYVRDGLAFLSHWNAGLVILDVGNGVAGGSPEAPVEVSRIELGGETHNAWYWPEAGYVFVGEEDFGAPGILRVVDVRDLSRPRVAATFAVPGETPHNVWLDEERGVLYAAWYGAGVRMVDVSGDLMGALERQGREMASALYDGCAGCGPRAAWAPQLHRGRVFVSDMNSGLVVLDPGG